MDSINKRKCKKDYTSVYIVIREKRVIDILSKRIGIRNNITKSKYIAILKKISISPNAKINIKNTQYDFINISLK